MRWGVSNGVKSIDEVCLLQCDQRQRIRHVGRLAVAVFSQSKISNRTKNYNQLPIIGGKVDLGE